MFAWFGHLQSGNVSSPKYVKLGASSGIGPWGEVTVVKLGFHQVDQCYRVFLCKGMLYDSDVSGGFNLATLSFCPIC